MKNFILSNKKIVVSVCALIVLTIAMGIFIQRKNSIDAMKSEDMMDSTNQATTEIEAWGEVVYSRIENINIDFPSEVIDIQVEEGERVILGQPLVTIDISEYTGNIEKLKSQLNANQLALDFATDDMSALQADITKTQNDISIKSEEYNNGTNADIKLLQNSLNLAMKELENAKSDLESYQALYQDGAVSQAVLNQYTTMFNQHQKAVDDINANLQKTKSALKDELGLLNISLKSKQIQLSQLQEGNSLNVAMQQSGVSANEIDLNNMINKLSKDYIKENQIISNVNNGIVKNIAIDYGSRLGTQGMPTQVLQIIDADSIAVSAEVYEEFIGSVKIGDSVRIVPASSMDSSIEGTVTHIPELAIEKDGRRVICVIIKPDDPDNILKPGFTADVYFQK